VSTYPERIVCLTDETVEILYRLGQARRVVGVSGYAVRPPEVRQKPKVAAFVTARFDKIEALDPDLVLGFSDLQADLATELVRRGLPVVIFNQRSVTEILQAVRMVGGLVGCQTEAAALAGELEEGLERIRQSASRFPCRLRTFFEEWDDPLISGIRWVEELIALAGGEPILPELGEARLARDRVIDPSLVIARDPEVIFASWCGKPMRKATITGRAGWHAISAVRHDRVFEIDSVCILQPGPASLTDGVRLIHERLATVHGLDVDHSLRPGTS
jgi:iron complex transport system substrate-binding protein